MRAKATDLRAVIGDLFAQPMVVNIFINSASPSVKNVSMPRLDTGAKRREPTRRGAYPWHQHGIEKLTQWLDGQAAPEKYAKATHREGDGTLASVTVHECVDALGIKEYGRSRAGAARVLACMLRDLGWQKRYVQFSRAKRSYRYFRPDGQDGRV
ncbi:hypothetical protein [Oleiagrimonas sp. C23AA]|uniref:hypothetical protein n=1 Tax=Oleiagrimonas sp. C23AA TaxID=2719047 RepID=UPI00141DB33B|nr:hypothetical protein [Oleiagrimonas sp. C23AA]NII11763.1 hypothetical protein [Oleiagrimonas sp. C23AA]